MVIQYTIASITIIDAFLLVYVLDLCQEVSFLAFITSVSVERTFINYFSLVATWKKVIDLGAIE